MTEDVLIDSSPLTLQWLYKIKSEVEKKIPSVIYIERKYWATYKNPIIKRNFVLLHPQEGKIRLATKLTPSPKDFLEKTPSTKGYAKGYPSMYIIQSEDMIDNAVKLIIRTYKEYEIIPLV